MYKRTYVDKKGYTVEEYTDADDGGSLLPVFNNKNSSNNNYDNNNGNYDDDSDGGDDSNTRNKKVNTKNSENDHVDHENFDSDKNEDDSEDENDSDEEYYSKFDATYNYDGSGNDVDPNNNKTEVIGKSIPLHSASLQPRLWYAVVEGRHRGVFDASRRSSLIDLNRSITHYPHALWFRYTTQQEAVDFLLGLGILAWPDSFVFSFLPIVPYLCLRSVLALRLVCKSTHKAVMYFRLSVDQLKAECMEAFEKEDEEKREQMEKEKRLQRMKCFIEERQQTLNRILALYHNAGENESESESESEPERTVPVEEPPKKKARRNRSHSRKRNTNVRSGNATPTPLPARALPTRIDNNRALNSVRIIRCGKCSSKNHTTKEHRVPVKCTICSSLGHSERAHKYFKYK